MWIDLRLGLYVLPLGAVFENDLAFSIAALPYDQNTRENRTDIERV